MQGSLTTHDTSARSGDRAASTVAGPIRAIALPVLSLLITGMVHFTLEAIWPDLKTTFIPPVLAPLLLAYGVWVGYRVVEAGGGYVGGILAGALLGLLPLALDVVGFGIILGRGTTPGAMAGIFGFSQRPFFDLGENRAQLEQAPSVKF